MKIDFNPNAVAHRPSNAGNQSPQTTPASTGQSGGGDEINISPEAQQALASGSTVNSPAFQARAAIAGGAAAAVEGAEDLSSLPFGQVVKQFTPGHLMQAAAAAEAAAAAAAAAEEEGSTVEEGGEVADGGEVAEGEETPTETPEAGETSETAPTEEPVLADDGAVPDEGVAPDEGEPTIVVEEPDPTELLAGEEDSGVVDDSQPAAEDDTIVTDSPVVTADTDTLIEELIEELDEGAGEVT